MPALKAAVTEGEKDSTNDNYDVYNISIVDRSNNLVVSNLDYKKDNNYIVIYLDKEIFSNYKVDYYVRIKVKRNTRKI